MLDLNELKRMLARSKNYGHAYFFVLDANMDFYFSTKDSMAIGGFVRRQYPNSRITRSGLIDAELNILAKEPV